jgi:HlyD family secretion protein
MKNKVGSAIGGIVAILVILGIAVWYMSAPSESYLQGQADATQINVAPKIPGRVEDILVKEGDRVTQGQVLVVIGTPEIDAKLLQAESVKKSSTSIR